MTEVSVVIPAHNAEAYIAAALASICEQTLQHVEVLLIDDGSTDQTVREAERFNDRLDLVVLRQKNAGPAAARNAGIRHARGRYCAFLDADDLMLPQRLASQVLLFETDPELGLVHTDLMTFDERGIIHRTRRAFSDPCGGWVIERLLLDNFITTSTVMVPRQRLLDAGLFNEARRISEDFELWLGMAMRWKVGFVDRPMVQYRRRSDSLSNDKLVTARSALDVVESFWREHPEFRQSHGALCRKSLGHHLAAAGSAALGQGKRRTAFAYLLRSLAHAPFAFHSWKWLAKAAVDRLRRRPRASDCENPGARP